MKKILLFLISLILVSENSFSQVKKVGKVINDDGIPLSGVFVIEKGTKNVVTTNDLGLYVISGNNIGLSAVSGNNIGVTSISANNIVPRTITGNLIANNAISGNNIVSPPDIFDDAFLFGGM
jgi:hypothetical protein